MARRLSCHKVKARRIKERERGMSVRGKGDGKSSYHEVYARSLADPEGFWAEAAKRSTGSSRRKKIFDPSQGVYGRWFSGGVVNTCYNAPTAMLNVAAPTRSR